ncbi:MAG: 50S ribosomal protein L11 methyltransferase [Bacteroidales bacterium]|nr:50S ribosomal protein L11 methyltransferase [Bacteroidales bacterium]
MNYYSVRLEHSLSEIETDLLTDDLAGLGFESFESDGAESAHAESARATQTLTAYIPAPAYGVARADIDTLLQDCGEKIITRTDTLIPDKDWNAEWEKSYTPVRFGDFCYVHAPFHQPLAQVRYNIEIEPKMSFGTAHHPTTSLMIRFLESEPPAGKRVLDMGCGTGVLGILSGMQGAESVLGIDIDEWAYRNALENVARNGLSERMRIEQGDASNLQGREFDVILANINRNILLRDTAVYAACLPVGGVLYLSGFYRQDMDLLEKECNAHRLFYQKHIEKQDAGGETWAAMKFLKK